MKRLKELRTQKSLTQTELGQLIGVNQSAVGKYERGELEPNLYIIKKLADIFDVTIDYLIGREDDFGNVVSAASPSAELSFDEWELITKYRSLDPRYRTLVEDQIKTLSELSSDIVKNK